MIAVASLDASSSSKPMPAENSPVDHLGHEEHDVDARFGEGLGDGVSHVPAGRRPDE